MLLTCGNCGHSWESSAKSRSRCGNCGKAVSVPSDGAAVASRGRADIGPGSTGGGTMALAVVFVIFGAFLLHHAKTADPTRQPPGYRAWHWVAGGIFSIGAGGCSVPTPSGLSVGPMTTDAEPMDIALRAWALPDKMRPSSPQRRRHRPSALVVLDTETELVGAQNLIVGCYRYVRVKWRNKVPMLSSAEEALVVPDDLGEREPDQLALVREYAATREPNVDRSQRDANRTLHVLSHHEFCERMLWGACWRNRATLVGFNLGFDVSRLRLSWHEGRGLYAGAFVLRLWEWGKKDHRFRPNVVMRRLDNKRTLMAWSGVRDAPDDGDEHRSSDDHFLDLRTLLFALTNQAHSLESGSSALGLDYRKREVTLGALSEELLDYVREDVGATSALAGAALREFHRHPVPLSADRAYSSAAIGAAYFRRIGVKPPLERAEVTSTQLAQAMGSFYGPRVEVRIRHVAVPVSLVDFGSQYANVARLMGIWPMLTSERIVAVDATDEVRELLDRVSVDGVLDPGLWPLLVGMALVRPDGDVLPTRAWFAGRGDVPRVGLGPLWCGRPLPYQVADLVAAKLLTGKAPEVVSAWRLVGEGRARGLRVVRLGGRVRFDPYADDWWEACQRARVLLGDAPVATGMKTVGNGTAYGNWIRLDQQPTAGRVTLHRLDAQTEQQRVDRPESPAAWTFPPFAAAVTAGGRLLMAILERLLGDVGALFASANTDSATVVSTPHGGLVACPGGSERLSDGTEAVGAASWPDLDAVRERFSSLGVELRLTSENFDGTDRPQLHAVGFAGSRVILFADSPNGRIIVKRSEVALGDLRSPFGQGTSRRFVDESAEWMLSHLLDEHPVTPEWFPLPATTDLPMGTPGKVRSLGQNGSPLGFAMGARRARRGTGVFGGEPVRLLAPASDDPASALWVEVPSGTPARVATTGRSPGRDDSGVVEIAPFGEELVRLVLHPESKMLGQNGETCRAGTKGLLTPRPVRVAAVHLVGKEGNRLEEVATGEVTDPDEVLIDYGNDAWDRTIVPAARLIGMRRISRETKIAWSQLVDLFQGRARPRQSTREVVTAVVVSHATEWLASAGMKPARQSNDQLAILAMFLERAGSGVPMEG